MLKASGLLTCNLLYWHYIELDMWNCPKCVHEFVCLCVRPMLDQKPVQGVSPPYDCRDRLQHPRDSGRSRLYYMEMTMAHNVWTFKIVFHCIHLHLSQCMLHWLQLATGLPYISRSQACWIFSGCSVCVHDSDHVTLHACPLWVEGYRRVCLRQWHHLRAWQPTPALALTQRTLGFVNWAANH